MVDSLGPYVCILVLVSHCIVNLQLTLKCVCVACPVFLVLPFCRAALSERIYMCRRSSGSAKTVLCLQPPIIEAAKISTRLKNLYDKIMIFNPNILYLDVRMSVKWVLLCYDMVYGDWGFKKGLQMLNNHFFYKFGQV